MMNLLSESRRVEADQHIAADLQAGLLISDVSKKEVSRLEFHTVGNPKADTADTKVETLDDGPSPLLQEEKDHAETHLREEAIRARIEAAKIEARQSAREEWERELAACIADEKDRVVRTCERFSRERSRYFAEVETEVVKLALAIATRVLHREAQFDPLLLSAAVRVVLEKLAEESGVVMRVPAKDRAAWHRVIEDAVLSGVELVGDERLEAGDCVLDTNVGKIELGVKAQLVEIERGFFDMLQRRPS